jgi:hypothetical protein
MAAATVRVVQVAVLLRQLPEGGLAVAELHGAHAAAAAHLGRVHALQRATPRVTHSISTVHPAMRTIKEM